MHLVQAWGQEEKWAPVRQGLLEAAAVVALLTPRPACCWGLLQGVRFWGPGRWVWWLWLAGGVPRRVSSSSSSRAWDSSKAWDSSRSTWVVSKAWQALQVQQLGMAQGAQGMAQAKPWALQAMVLAQLVQVPGRVAWPQRGTQVQQHPVLGQWV